MIPVIYWCTVMYYNYAKTEALINHDEQADIDEEIEQRLDNMVVVASNL